MECVEYSVQRALNLSKSSHSNAIFSQFCSYKIALSESETSVFSIYYF